MKNFVIPQHLQRFVESKPKHLFTYPLDLQMFAEEEEEEEEKPEEKEEDKKEEQPAWVKSLMQTLQTISDKVGEEAPNKKTEEVKVPPIPEPEPEPEEEGEEPEPQVSPSSKKKSPWKWLMG